MDFPQWRIQWGVRMIIPSIANITKISASIFCARNMNLLLEYLDNWLKFWQRGLTQIIPCSKRHNKLKQKTIVCFQIWHKFIALSSWCKLKLTEGNARVVNGEDSYALQGVNTHMLSYLWCLLPVLTHFCNLWHQMGYIAACKIPLDLYYIYHPENDPRRISQLLAEQ